MKHWGITFFVFITLFLRFSWASASNPDSISHPSLVFIEGYDGEGKRVSLGTGVIIKEGFVATNYHYVTGHEEIGVFKSGESKKFVSNGYLSVDEDSDIILLSVPGIKGKAAKLGTRTPPPDGTILEIIDAPTSRKARYVKGTVKSTKEIMERDLPQIISHQTEECTGGPVFYEDWMVGFITAGYLDGKYYAYLMPVKHLLPILNRSFIIKDFNSLKDQVPLATSHYQKSLMESLTAVLWLPINDAMRLAKKKKKKILVDVYTDWCGWCKIMDKNTYSQKRIIRYANENYYSVRFDAEAKDSLAISGRIYRFLENLRVNELAYSLLDGNMEYPSTVFLDENANLLTIIPGYINPDKMEVVLHYFAEDAYKPPAKTYQEFEAEFHRREQE